MSSKFEEDMAMELERQAHTRTKQQEFDVARAAVRQGLIDKIIGAAGEFRDTMVAHGVPPQPLHAHVEYSDSYAYRKDRRKLPTQWREDFDTRHRGWQSLHTVYSPADYSGNTAQPGGWMTTGPFVTTDGQVLEAGGGFFESSDPVAPPTPLWMLSMMTKPAVVNLSNLRHEPSYRWDKFDGPPEWVARKQPAPLAEAQQVYLDTHVDRFDPAWSRSNRVYENEEQAARDLAANQERAGKEAEAVRYQLVDSALLWIQHSTRQA